jgi:hypothetical protein
VDHCVTQALKGHGVFGTSLQRIKKQEHSHCWYCDEESNGPEHTVFQCPEWNEVRNRTNLVGAIVDASNVEEILLCRDEESSKVILNMLRRIMKVRVNRDIKMEREQQCQKAVQGVDSRRKGFSWYRWEAPGEFHTPRRHRVVWGT